MSIETEPAPTPGGAEDSKKSGQSFRERVGQRLLATPAAGLAIFVAILWVFLALFVDGFLASFNIFALGRRVAVDVVIGFSQMAVLAVGGLNLAVGAIGGICTMMFGWLVQEVGIPWPVAAGLAIGLGAAAGYLNGVLVVVTRLHSFIITLGTASVFTGLMLILTRAEAFRGLPATYTALATNRLFGYVSPLLLIMLATAFGLFYLYSSSSLGRETLTVGANPRAALVSGIAVPKIIRRAHMLSGLLAGLAAVMLTARLGSAMPSVGNDWLLTSFVAPIIGGTLISGGLVSVVGTAVGGLLVGTFRSGLQLLRADEFWIQLFLGLLLLIAVIADRVRTVRMEQRKAKAA